MPRTLYNGDHPKRNDAKRIATCKKKASIREKLVVKKRLQGKSQNRIAAEITKETGVHVPQQRVFEILKREHVQAMLEKEYCKLASAVPKATENIINAAYDFGKDQGGEDKKISWEANKLIAQAHGIIPTAQQSIVHQTFIQNQVNNVIPPIIAELALKHFGGMLNMQSNKQIEAPIDAEVIP